MFNSLLTLLIYHTIFVQLVYNNNTKQTPIIQKNTFFYVLLTIRDENNFDSIYIPLYFLFIKFTGARGNNIENANKRLPIKTDKFTEKPEIN